MGGNDSGTPPRATRRRAPGVPPQRPPSEPLTVVRSRRLSSARTNPARAFSVLTGVLVGLLAVALVTMAQGTCPSDETVCGRSQVTTLSGMLLLPVLGAGLLGATRVRHPVRTSVVAVGLLTVAVMLFVVDTPMSPLRGVAVVALSAGAFTLARQLTATYVVR